MGSESVPHRSPVRSKRATGTTLEMHEVSFEEALDLIRDKDHRYAREAYLFVREALDHTQKKIAKESRGRIRHVTGQELLAGIRDFALLQFGPMAMFVLEEWGIHACGDFGEIVFNMVDIGLLAKTEKDSRADFRAATISAKLSAPPFYPQIENANYRSHPRPRRGINRHPPTIFATKSGGLNKRGNRSSARTTTRTSAI
jgi:uncharacterized repeat protein (TIGR04138 family)